MGVRLSPALQRLLDKSAGRRTIPRTLCSLIEAVRHDVPLARISYLSAFILLSSIGLIGNTLCLLTVIRNRIRSSVCGLYLMVYSTCSLVLMVLTLLNIISAMRYDTYLFRLWTCHGYPYLCLVMVSTGTLISAAIAVESVLITCFDRDKFHLRQRALFLSCFFLACTAAVNLDKILARRLIIDERDQYVCVLDATSSRFWLHNSPWFVDACTLAACLVHSACLLCILFLPAREKCLSRFVVYRHHLIPSAFIIFCLLSHGIYRYISHFCLTHATLWMSRSHAAFVFLLYAPQLLTFWIYVLPNKTYVREFYQMWFYRRLCCCLYKKKRQVQQFEVIHRLWQRRTSVETIKTITSLDDMCIDSEFYKKIKWSSERWSRGKL